MGKTSKKEPIRKEKGSKKKDFDRKDRRENKRLNVNDYK
jgi:hypothetical protein